ncbi:2-iminoacetate synthase ThiH [Evansella cellulosilytica]|uniref:Thiazole biosynthesis protein ThiH n=1 Tax=Evansella cellulosilytica (strain ATCC 21833 / DSM 2522 / FERM P-1141 / JCM 9156 / N-4) TaxID=649639 RepID=E6U038_EVAC2|nr:2-iminoacetate synthase ThiH [Evansella cellulosilytica]ADU29042.1 thiazole biosynthesis protein ThiH [Evansella cellulosilytica DSM 2522]
MSFYEKFETVKDLPFDDMFSSVSIRDVEKVLQKERLTEEDYFVLLSPAAENYLEEMAQKAHQLTVQHFGKTIGLYLPLYLSDYCVNICKYCSFSFNNDFPRRRLTMEEIHKEAKIIADMGIKHIILLSGESKQHSSIEYLKESMEVLKHYFSSVGVEIQPLDQDEYEQLFAAGIDGLTVYQEVYNEEIYRDIHVAGPKKDFRYRLDTPERGAKAGLRSINVGALLGMDEWRKESYMTGLHASYLQNKFLEIEVGVSFPRMRPHAGSFQPKVIVSDKNLVQAMLAIRLFLPRAGINISTRETPEFRESLIPLGVTKMSAASSTVVGGYSEPDVTQSQFEISDDRSVEEIKTLLKQKGYQPVVKDWQLL